MGAAVRQAVAQGRKEGSHFHPDAAIFAEIEGESIDYAVMENTARAAMVPVQMGWSDIGNWAALQDALAARSEGADADGNVVRGSADLVNCANVFTSSDGPRVSAIGLNDLCIVVSGDEVLVTTRDGAQSVGKLPGASDQ
jgi:mannose-1-phosphate guanylyltransferase/mannose-1-phosphate guanylyltransferase/mannose-6-phosphate isomerase